ncbi:glutaredoxin family protein [Clostridium sp.]|uniref:glutaredoxin family protein n=1 Tax=Clostridium sp. TaxID=1506 RepID=UPI003995283E
MIKVFSTTTCPWCVKAKDYLKAKNLEYVDLNVSEDMEAREEMIKKSNQMGVPVLDINGKIIVGFDRKAIDEAIESL